jgi:hypothetical protein
LVLGRPVSNPAQHIASGCILLLAYTSWVKYVYTLPGTAKSANFKLLVGQRFLLFFLNTLLLIKNIKKRKKVALNAIFLLC